MYQKIKLIVGITGPIYSGCTTASKWLEGYFHFHRISISENFIDYPLTEQLGHPPERWDRQNFGDTARKENQAYFVEECEKYLLEKWNADPSSFPEYIVVECLRNHAEVLDFKRRFQDKFYLIAIYADKETRANRAGLNPADFKEVNDRDQGVLSLFGQQVKYCIELADVFLSNNENVFNPQSAEDENVTTYFNKRIDDFINYEESRKDFIQIKEWKPFFGFINELNRSIFIMKSEKHFYPLNILVNEIHPDKPTYSPTPKEILMNISYMISLLSECRKRKVGAIITKESPDKKHPDDSYILSSGWNQVVLQENFCHLNEFCFRDYNKLKEFFKGFKKCPICGNDLECSCKCRLALCDDISIEPEDTIDVIKSKIKCVHDNPSYYDNVDKEIIIRCKDSACKFNNNENPSDNIKKIFPLKDLYDCQAVHAEENAILNSARFGSANLSGSTLYTTTFPCFLCVKKIISADIKKVVFLESYPDTKAFYELRKANIEPEQFVGFTPFRYYKLFKQYFL